MKDSRLSIVVFAYNEAENIAPVLAELLGYLDAHHPGTEIVFVDDGSRDATSEVARAALLGRDGCVLRHESNRGIGAALKTGVRACHADWVTFMPADGQIEPAAISKAWTWCSRRTINAKTACTASCSPPAFAP
jgi:glycosyltransferase involved in cell wall biosynthesis